MTRSKDDDTGHYEGAMLEDILDRVKGIAEGQTTLSERVDRLETTLGERIGTVEARLSNIEGDVAVIKADTQFIRGAVAEQAGDLDDHEQRLRRLEKRAA
jgi:hypothetical protein